MGASGNVVPLIGNRMLSPDVSLLKMKVRFWSGVAL